jgi:hypothetical protein
MNRPSIAVAIRALPEVADRAAITKIDRRIDPRRTDGCGFGCPETA